MKTDPSPRPHSFARATGLVVAVSCLLLGVQHPVYAQARGSVEQARGSVEQARGGVGQELDKLKRETDLKRPRPTDKKKPEVEIKSKPAEKKAAKKGKGRKTKVTSFKVTGDASALDELGLRRALDSEIMGRSLTRSDATAIAGRYQKRLVENGYYLALVTTEGSDFRKGAVVFHVDVGRVGKLSFSREQDGKRRPYRGRFYSEQQLRDRMGQVHPGAPFDYAKFYNGFYAINAHPDLRADVDLNVRKQGKGDAQKRYVDMDFVVEERIPVHGIIELNNSGTDVTDEWGLSLTLQHLNLTKHDDILTINIPTSLDFKSLRSVAGSYLLPYASGQGGYVSLFGGFSKLDSDNVIEGGSDFRVKGDGWYGGGQVSYNLIADARRELALSLGISHNNIDERLLFADTDVAADGQPLDVKTTPLSLALVYNSLQPDRWGGRHTLALVPSIHIGGFLGASDDDKFALQRENAPADYAILRFNYARVQALRELQSPTANDWLLFVRADGQWSTDPLIPAEQMGAGGSGTVRGYKEREFLGDDGVTGTLELRAPVKMTGYLKPFRKAGDTSADYWRLQAIGFVDGGYVSLQDVSVGEDSSQELFSAGLGFRVSMGKYAQLRFDWGFPLVETEESDSSGAGHVNVQMQF